MENTTKNTQNNGWERIAKENLKNAYNWRVGEIWNAVQDGDMTEEQFQNWMQTEALDDIYHEAITTLYTGDSCGGEAPKEMRFAGKEFCYKYLISLFKKDGYTVASPETKTKKTTTKTKAAKKSTKTAKTTTTITVVLKAFTGMVIGTYTTEMTETGCKITAKNGKVLEFNAEGIQTNAKNPKFGNKIEIVEA